MGWGQGIGIGWPNASANTGTNVWYNIDSRCDGSPTKFNTTQLVSTANYKTGDYVYSPTAGCRVQLSNIATSQGANLLQIEGPVYDGCAVLVYFYINSLCNNNEPPLNDTTDLADSSIYSPGDYVYCPGLGTYIQLGAITTIGESVWPIEGPVFNSCPG